MYANIGMIFITMMMTDAGLQNKPLLLLIRKHSGRTVFRTQIFDSWTENLFHDNNVIAWKYINLPNWLPTEDLKKAYPSWIILKGQEPGCDI